jgi:hypothetical protein
MEKVTNVADKFSDSDTDYNAGDNVMDNFDGSDTNTEL